MKLCLASQLTPNGTTPCTHPLPCSVHGTRVEPVTVVLTEYVWLVEPTGTGGTILTLMKMEGEIECPIATRLIAASSTEAESVVRGAMLAAADLLPRRLAGAPLVGA